MRFGFSDHGDHAAITRDLGRSPLSFAVFKGFGSHCFTSKYTSVPGETFCPASGYCFTTVPVSAGAGVEFLFARTLALCTDAFAIAPHLPPSFNPACSTASAARASGLVTKFGITNRGVLSGAVSTRSTRGDVMVFALGGGLCATTVCGAAPSRWMLEMVP